MKGRVRHLSNIIENGFNILAIFRSLTFAVTGMLVMGFILRALNQRFISMIIHITSVTIILEQSVDKSTNPLKCLKYIYNKKS